MMAATLVHLTVAVRAASKVEKLVDWKVDATVAMRVGLKVETMGSM